MKIDDLPDQFEAWLDCARTAFNREVSAGQKALDALNAEKSSAQKAVAEVRTQLKQAQADLNATLGHQAKASELVALSSKAAALRQEVEKLTAEKSALEASVADLANQRAKAEAEVAGLARRRSHVPSRTGRRLRRHRPSPSARKRLEDVMADNDDKIAALEREVAELRSAVKAAAEPAKPDPEEAERRRREWENEMHQLRERRMAFATPPSVVRDLNVLGEDLLKGVRGDARAPTGRPGMIPQSQTSGGGGGGKGSGWVEPRPLTNPPGTPWVDAIAIADEVRQRKERERGG
jgi:predicted  nucleic acid-binding Zn-ribbon protein